VQSEIYIFPNKLVLHIDSRNTIFAPQFKGMEKLRKISCAVFLTLFVGMFLSNTIFPHSHTVRGIIIVHSHPYNPFSPEKHQHNDDEINLIAFLANCPVIVSETQEFSQIFLTPTPFVQKEYIPGHAQKEKVLFSRPRDPPIATLFS